LKLSQAGEFGLIERIRRIVGDKDPGVVLGIGDDAAVFRSTPGWLTVLTTDALVEGVHFHLRYTPTESLGWKALAVNISDVAAVGGIPRYAVVSLALPAKWSVEDVEALYRGMVRCGKAYGCRLVGGDTVRSLGGCFLSVALVGEVEEKYIIRRSGAQEGDLLCVTGEIGGARAGLEVLSAGQDRERFPESVSRFLEPRVRLQEARFLAQKVGVSSMIDISDGLSSEVQHLCRESHLGCRLWEEKIPLEREVILWAGEQGEDVSTYALGSGEEYELLFTVAKSKFEHWQKQGEDKNKVKTTVIGEMFPKKEGIKVVRRGKAFPLLAKGWDHFRNKG